jgi:hypothetical protein
MKGENLESASLLKYLLQLKDDLTTKLPPPEKKISYIHLPLDDAKTSMTRLSREGATLSTSSGSSSLDKKLYDVKPVVSPARLYSIAGTSSDLSYTRPIKNFDYQLGKSGYL